MKELLEKDFVSLERKAEYKVENIWEENEFDVDHSIAESVAPHGTAVFIIKK